MKVPHDHFQDIYILYSGMISFTPKNWSGSVLLGQLDQL